MGTRVHPTAVVDRRAELGEGVEVGAFCVVYAGARLGAGCVLHNHVTVHAGVSTGEGCVFSPWCVLGGEPQDLKYQGGETTLEIGAGTKVREHATLHRGTELGGGVTRVGARCLIMVGAHVAHDCILEDEVVLANSVMLGGHCLVEFGAGIGGGAGLHHFVTVGTLSFVGGMSRVTRDVPPYTVVEGNPAEVRRVNSTALARRGWGAEKSERMRDAYRALFGGESPASEAIARLRAGERPDVEVLRLCEFLERMEAGTYGRWREAQRAPSAARESQA